MAAFRLPLANRPRARRIVAGLLVALALAPGTFVRTPLPSEREQAIAIERVDELPPVASVGDFTRLDVWNLDSANMDFGGYSALILLGDGGAARAFSDRGTMMTITLPEAEASGAVNFASIGSRGRLTNTVPDIESATRDPISGDYWLAFEGDHAIIRYSAIGGLRALREPPEWSEWPVNSGPEAMARLPDGRFLILPERSTGALLYPSDPTDEVTPIRISAGLPNAFAPTDLAALPDGRVLVLMRRLRLGWPIFTAAIGLADPRGLEAGDTLEVIQIVDLDTLLPRENYEGLAVQPQPDGSFAVWIIADDNLASFQRTLLAKLRWTPSPPPQPE